MSSHGEYTAEGEVTRGKGPQAGTPPWATTARTKPLHMGRPLYQLS